MTRKEMTTEEQLDAAWQAFGPAQERLGKALQEVEEEITHQRKMWMGRWGTDTSGIVALAEQAHAAQAELNFITKKIAMLQEILRAH